MSRRWRDDPEPALPPGGCRRICVFVITYNRPDKLRRLLSDIEAFRGAHEVDVHVFDDGSTADYSEFKRANITWHGFAHHGKQRFWELVTTVYEAMAAVDAELFVSLPDDARLASGFFDEAAAAWHSIGARQKACLNVWRDPRDYCWTGVAPRDVNERVRETGWVDGAFICDRSYFNVRIRPIPENFWDINPNRGSGVGQRVTTALQESGHRMFQVRRSLMAHAGCRVSQMNPEDRVEHPLRAVDFADGQRVCDALEFEEPVVASVASIDRRVALLERTVATLLPQVDELRVYLNGYSSVPRFLDHPRVIVARSQEHGDVGDAGKFFWRIDRGYHLTCDDDLLYPADYVRRMVAVIEQYQRKALVSFHGARLRSPVEFGTRHIIHCTKALADATRAHLGGTGVMGRHVSTIAFERAHFRIPNMADVWAAVQAKKVGVPIFVAPHEGGWIISQEDPKGGIYEKHRKDGRVQTDILRAAGTWPTL